MSDQDVLNFTESELAYVAETYEKMHLVAGQELFAEGSDGDFAYIVLDGQLEVIKASGDRDILLNVVKRGEVVGEMALLENKPRMASVRARTDTELIPVNETQFNEVLNTCPAVARGMLSVVLSRARATEARLRQTQHMANWNALTAGVAHELNNPAAAINRGVEQLRSALDPFGAAQGQLGQMAFDAAQAAVVAQLRAEIQERAVDPAEPNALVCSDLEYEIETWLDERTIADAWTLSPVLVSMGFDVPRLEALSAGFDDDQFRGVLAWVCASFTAYGLLAEIAGASAHISGIVGVLKGYSYLDQAPVQMVNVTEGLDHTLLLLRRRMGDGITIRREFAPDLPRINAYGRELNQAWTNIIDNAITAVGGTGEIVIRARRDDAAISAASNGGSASLDWIRIEIQDDGPGIPPDVMPVLFDPFFTTKSPGMGTGLGLNITYNIVVQKHRGEILVDSEPGRTVFTVRLPVDFERL